MKAWQLRYGRCAIFFNVPEETDMLHWALVFLVVAIIAALLGFTGVAGTASSIAWILFVVGLILALVFFLRGRTPL